jgi:hypothetical protein
VSGSFGSRLSLRPGDRPCVHCGKGLSDHFLSMSEKRCYFPKTSTRYEPVPEPNADLGALDLDDHAALELLFNTLLRGGDAKSMMRRASMVGAMRKLHVMHERAKAESEDKP